MRLFRKTEEIIRKWYEGPENKALLVKGARQVGKTYLIREVLSDLGADYVEFNLIDQPEVIDILDQSRSVDDLITGLSTISPLRIIKGKTTIFIDEIQKYKEAVTRIKFLVDEGSLQYILSGSLLGIELTDLESAPVGYLHSIEMFPLDFEEFLYATNISKDVLDTLRECFNNRRPVMDAVNRKMLDFFNKYLIVGGMPEAVSIFAETGNVNDVMAVHKDIVDQYKLDFTKYESENKKLRLINAYELIPSELLKQNRRYILTDLKSGLHFERVENTFIWFYKAGVAIPAFNTTEPRIPLKLNEKQSLFKLYLSDVGILTSIYGMNTKRMLLSGDVNLNAGGIYENAIACELHSKGYKLNYYNSNRLGELDFVIEYNGTALPIEVKSGKYYTIHSAVNNCLNNKEYEMKEAFVFANCNISQNDRITYLPVYMVMFMNADEEEMIIGNKWS